MDHYDVYKFTKFGFSSTLNLYLQVYLVLPIICQKSRQAGIEFISWVITFDNLGDKYCVDCIEYKTEPDNWYFYLVK